MPRLRKTERLDEGVYQVELELHDGSVVGSVCRRTDGDIQVWNVDSDEMNRLIMRDGDLDVRYVLATIDRFELDT